MAVRTKTRKAQIERGVLVELIKALREHGLNYASLDAVRPGMIADALKQAAVIGAVTERTRILRQIDARRPLGLKWLSDWIVGKSVNDVLGYENSKASPARSRAEGGSDGK